MLRLTDEQKDWLTEGTYDLDVLIAAGAISFDRCVELLNTLEESPWKGRMSEQHQGR